MNTLKKLFAVVAILSATFFMTCAENEDYVDIALNPNRLKEHSVPHAPTGVTATANSSSSITISWDAVEGATGYRIYRSTTGSSGSFTQIGSTNSSTRTYRDNDLSVNTTYYYNVAAYNSVGTGSSSSTVNAKTETSGQPPAVPTNLTATATSATSIRISWNAVEGATGYYVYYSTSATGTFTLLGSLSQGSLITATTYTHTGLTAGTTYYYRVAAHSNSAGTGEQSSTVSARTFPAAPWGVTATADSSSSIRISWSTMYGVTGYYVYRSTSATGTFSLIDSTTTTSYTDAGLNAGWTYYYRVAAYDNSGVGNQSVTVSATAAQSAVDPNTVLRETVTYGGQTYNTVTIGTQTWMAENLNFEPDNGNSWCYGDNPSNCDIYGKLYDWATVMNLPSSCNSNSCASQVLTHHQGICPNGWRVPNREDWTTLINAVGGTLEAVTRLKSQSGWQIGNGTDDYGFSALPGGTWSVAYSYFTPVGFGSNWWSATEHSLGSYAWSPSIEYSNSRDVVMWSGTSKSNGFSVRCIRD